MSTTLAPSPTVALPIGVDDLETVLEAGGAKVPRHRSAA